MNLVCIGLSHKTAPVEQREKAALSEHAARSLLRHVRSHGWVNEIVALSTCNRTEIYGVGEDLAQVEEELVQAIVEHTAIGRGELDCARYLHLEDRAAGHLFRVTASLDSMVLGESEIQGQVVAAWDLAREEDAAGPVLNHLFRHSVEVGKRVRNETRITQGPTSVAAVAVQLARDAFGDLPRRRALLIGAGQVGEATARALVDSGLHELTVANRTVSTARDVAEKVGGRGVGFDLLAGELQTADIVISSTDAPHPVLSREDIERVMATRPTRPLVLIDIAVPRDLDPHIGEVKGAVLYDIDDLERVVEASISERLREADAAETIVRAELHRFAEWRHGLAVAPTIRSLRERAEAIRRREVERMGPQWESLTEDDRARVDALTKAIVNKLLHEPTVRAREAAQNGEGLGHVETLRHLFDLPVPERPTVVRENGRRPAGSPRERGAVDRAAS
ncbi:MAG: glutamyl-tRNA reductase [Actinomycetota bacterium]